MTRMRAIIFVAVYEIQHFILFSVHGVTREKQDYVKWKDPTSWSQLYI
jgi:hypothetical protein